jgi:hypothetical protein
MDPLSIVASASALVSPASGPSKACVTFGSATKRQGAIIASISSECMVLHIALSQIQKLALIDSFFNRLVSQLDLKDSLELALLSCTQTLSALEEEIRELSYCVCNKVLGGSLEQTHQFEYIELHIEINLSIPTTIGV